jgi:hypothetical protein
MEIPANQLGNRNPSPTIVVSSMYLFPQGLRLDSAGNLWMVVGLQQIWKFTPNDRKANPPSPSLIVILPDGLGDQDFALDSSGNLWLAGVIFPAPGTTVDEIEMISAGDLVGAGEISPPASLTITSSAFGTEHSGLGGGPCIGGIDFDHSGDLWVSARCDPDMHLIEFTPSQLKAGGNLTPSVIIDQNKAKTNIAFPSPIRFGPTVN